MLRHRAGRLVLAMLGPALLSGCASISYLAQAARGQWQVMHRRQPLERVLRSPDTDPTLAARLQLASEARDFASRELGLPDNLSYRSYSALGRPYVVWNVVAAPAYSVEPLHWCFPIAGCVSYRGYFREAAARRYAAGLERRGYDVLVAGVPAYSTLGRLSDPLLDTMLRHGDDYIAATIFHELAHQLVYVKGDSDFNEAFATTVEQAGMRRWLAARGQEARLAAWQERQAMQADSAALFDSARTDLAALYAHRPVPADRPALKQARLAALASQLGELAAARGEPTGYERWIAAGLNNANVASVATYYRCVPGFQRLLAEQDGDLQRFYAAVRRLAKASASQRRQLCDRPP